MITAANNVLPGAPMLGRSPSPAMSEGGSFLDVFKHAANAITDLRRDADHKVKDLLAGNGTDVHTAMIATQKADLAFEFGLAIRNKAVGAYQQIMSMQF